MTKKITGHVKNLFQNKILVKKDFGLKKVGVGLTQGEVGNPPPHQGNYRVKLCWIVISFVRWGRIQNFRPLGPLFLVEVEFVCGLWLWVVWTAIIVSNPTSGWGYVELWLGWGFDNKDILHQMHSSVQLNFWLNSDQLDQKC